MTILILPYSDSLFNPIPKLLIPMLFAAGTYCFYKARQKLCISVDTIEAGGYQVYFILIH